MGTADPMQPVDPPPPTGAAQRKVHEAAAGALTVTTVGDGTSLVIAVYGEVDLGSVEALDAATGHALKSGAQQIVVDLGACHFIDSTGLGALVNLHRRVEARPDAELLLLPGPRAVQRALEVSGLLDVLPFPDA